MSNDDWRTKAMNYNRSFELLSESEINDDSLISNQYENKPLTFDWSKDYISLEETLT